MTTEQAGDDMSRKNRKERAEARDKEIEKEIEKEIGKEIEKEAEKASPQAAPQQEAAPEAPREEDKACQDALKAAQDKAEEYLTLAQRVQADFDNFRKRNASVRADSYEEGARDVIKTILPVVDNLERALQAAGEEDGLKEGVAMTLRQMMDILSKRGVEVIDREGEMFDPRFENAVMSADKSMGETGTVLKVFQKGYRMGDYVLRHAMVQVVGE